MRSRRGRGGRLARWRKDTGGRVLVDEVIVIPHGPSPFLLAPPADRGQRAIVLPRSDRTVHQPSRDTIPRPVHRATSPRPPAFAKVNASCPSGVFAQDDAVTSAAYSR